MAVDKKSDYYNPPTNYHDLDGNLKTFTYIDHDKKTKIGSSVISEEDASDAKKALTQYRKLLQDEILSLPASLCHAECQLFTVRGEALTKIEWNEPMVRDEGVDIWILASIVSIIKNKIEVERLTL